MACTPSKKIQSLFFLINLVLLLVLGAPQVSGLTQSLCSSDNTGSSSAVVTNLYQSNGRCFDTCKANYAFAVVQYQSCWCSNYAPAHTTSVSSCNQDCPGYPFEQCGSQSAGLFGYIALNKSPSGTIGASSASSSNTPTSTPPSSSLTAPSPTTSSLPQAASPPSSLLGSSTFVQQSSTVSSLIPSAQISPPNPSPVTVQETLTASPSVRTSLVSITPSISSTQTPEPSSGPGFIPGGSSFPTRTPPPLLDSTSSTSSTASTSSSSSTTVSPTPTTVSPTPTPSSTLSTPPPPPPVISSTLPTSSSSSSWSPTPITSVMTVTGVVTVVTITPTAPSTTNSAPPKASSSGGFLGTTGKAAGFGIGLGFLILACIGGALWFLRHRHKRYSDALAVSSYADGEQTPQRRPSRLSQMGLLGGNSRPMSERVPGIDTSNWGPGGSADKSPDEIAPMPYLTDRQMMDPRLEPSVLMQRDRFNNSSVSLGDDQDYSRRVLRVTNSDK